MATYETYPFKTSDKGTIFGQPRRSATRKAAARDRNDICVEMSSAQRAWTGASTYTPAGTIKRQTQASPVS